MIRKAVKNDTEAIMKIWLDTNIKSHSFISADYWHNNFETVKELISSAEIYVYEDNRTNRVEGFIGFNDNHIEGIFVKEAVRSNGIGKQLLDYAKNIKSALSLNVYQKNERAIQFYLREEFSIHSENVDDNTGEKEFIMVWNHYKFKFMEEVMKNTNQLIGCCGLDCEKCDARIATLTNDNTLREKTAVLWTKLNGVTITPEMINCTGCRIDGAKTPFCDKLCPVHNCAREKGLDTCADCGEMDECPTLGQIAANSQFVLENLKRLKQDNASYNDGK